MKRSISILSALVFTFIFSASAFAQAGSQDVTASTNIISSLDFTTETNLNFGDLPNNFSTTSGEQPSIVPVGDGSFTSSNTGTGTQGGEVTITTGSAQEITVTIDSPVALTNSDESSSINFAPDHVVTDGADENDVTVDTDNGTATITTTGSGSDFTGKVYLGGQLTSTPSATGTHDGTITINVDYTTNS